jgi:hypothetical protein
MRDVFSSKKVLAGIVAAVLLVFVVTGALPIVTQVYAADPTPTVPAKPARVGGRAGDPAWLAFQLQREQIALTTQQDNINRVGDVASAVQSLIDEEKAAGKETAALAAALTSFNLQIKAAQAPHDNAVTTLDAKAGFDANGKVTDAIQGRQTLKTAAQSMADARRMIRQTTTDLRTAFRQFIQANRPANTSRTASAAAQPAQAGQ